MSNANKTSRLKHGFTIVELIVVAPIVILTIGAFITVIVNMTGDVLASRTSNALAYSVQDALNRIEEDVKLSTSFIAANNVTLTSPQGFDDATAGFVNNNSTNGYMLILNTLATTGNPISTTSGLIYLKDQPNDCSDGQITQNKPLTINIVYFIKNNTLWRRTLMPSNYATAGCAIPWQQTSCSPTVSNAFCKSEDIRLVDNIATSGFNVQYFNTANNLVADTVANDTSKSITERNIALRSLTTVSANITVETTAAGRAISQSATIRATKLDINASSIAPIITAVTPSAPSGVGATFNSPGRITVNWNANAPNYNLQYDTTSSFSSPTTVSNLTGTSLAVTGLNRAPTYYFRVQSFNTAGTSPWSTTVSSNSTITNGLVVWWPFNGNANDFSGANYNGTVIGATLTTGQNGQTNSAYNFTTSVNTITSSTIPVMSTRLTLSAWIKPSAIPAERYTIMEGITPAGAYYLSMNTDRSLQVYWYSTSVEGYHSSGVNTINLNVWSHVVGSWDGTNARLYVNGVLRNTVAVTGVGRAASNLMVGAESPSRQYLGAMDDVREYSRALSDAEILSLYNDGAR